MHLKYNTINKQIDNPLKAKTIYNKYNNKTTENNKKKIIILSGIKLHCPSVGSCHHDMARPLGCE